MKFGRIFANAIVRRVAYVLVAMALAWLGLGDARAATYSTQGAAYAGCKSAEATYSRDGYLPAPDSCSEVSQASAGPPPHDRYQCIISWEGGPTYRYACGYREGVNDQGDHIFPRSQSCAAQPSTTFSHDLSIPTGSTGCNGGCEFVVTNNGDGTYSRNYGTPGLGMCNVLPDCPLSNDWYLNAVTGLCTPAEEECPANQTKNPKTKQCEEACPTGMVMDPTGACKPSADDCPAGNVRAPSGECLPGEGQCAAGEARRPNGTCGRDSDGDGQADEDDEDPENDPDRETASGGDSCSAPPSCSGGPIDCLQAKIQWRIDCNTRHKVNVTGGACGAMPVCVGENCKAMEYAQLLQQWKAACALEKLANADGGGEGGNNADLIALLTGPGSINGEHGDTGGMPGGDGPFQWGEGEEHEPDTTGFGYGSSCPSPPSFTVGGRTISIDLTIMCQWVSLAGSIVLILAGLASVRIVSGGIA